MYDLIRKHKPKLVFDSDYILLTADILVVDGNPLEDITAIGGNDRWFDAEPREQDVPAIRVTPEGSQKLATAVSPRAWRFD